MDAETQAMRVALSERTISNPDEFDRANQIPKAGTPAAKLDAEVKQRLTSENPHQAEYEQARGKFLRADEIVQSFKARHCRDRIEELEPEFNVAGQGIRDAAADLLRACEQYAANVEATRGIVSDTPMIDRSASHEPALGFDARPAEWAAVARDILDTDIAKPGLTEIAVWRLEQNRV
jgi:hypothetical protein